MGRAWILNSIFVICYGCLCCVQDMDPIWLLSFGITESITAGAEISNIFHIFPPFIVLAQTECFYAL